MTSSAPQPTERIDPHALRRALGNFVTGVTVVTTVEAAGRPRGLTANSFTSVSLDPPLILVCIANGAGSAGAFARCHSFSVNVLSEEQHAVSDIFASSAPDKFERVSWRFGSNGAPALPGSLAILECRVHDRVGAGDHTVLIGEVVDFAVAAGRPLVYGQGGYMPLGVQQAAVSAPPGKDVVVSCVAEFAGKVLLAQDRAAGGAWSLPHASLSGGGNGDLVPLKAVFRRLGIRAEITFLYSVFESQGPETVHIVYRGALSEPPDVQSGARLFEVADVPWGTLWPAQLHGLLRRFFHERSTDQFGVYSDFEEGGRVARIGDAAEAFDNYLSRFGDNSDQAAKIPPTGTGGG